MTKRWLVRAAGAVLATSVLAPAAPAQDPQKKMSVPKKIPMILPPTIVEGESMVPKAKPSAGPVMAQPGGNWSGHAQLFWKPPAPVDKPIPNYPHLTLYFDAQPGLYHVVFYHTVAPDYGKVRVFLNGEPRGDYDGWNGSVSTRRFGFDAKLSAGLQQLVLTVMGKAAQSSNHFVGVDYLKLMPK